MLVSSMFQKELCFDRYLLVLNTCGLDDGGLIHCWGAGESDLGTYPDYGQSIVPAGVFSKVVVGDYHSCAQDEDGLLTCWGNLKMVD